MLFRSVADPPPHLAPHINSNIGVSKIILPRDGPSVAARRPSLSWNRPPTADDDWKRPGDELKAEPVETHNDEERAKKEGKKGEWRRCLNCGRQKTPQWRVGPEGPKTLCNACGVRFRKQLPLHGT